MPINDLCSFSHGEPVPQVKILIPMSQWAAYVRSIFSRLEPPSIDELDLPGDHVQMIAAKATWEARAFARGAPDFEGTTWPQAFRYHSIMRQKIEKNFLAKRKLPTVAELNEALIQQSEDQHSAAKNDLGPDPVWNLAIKDKLATIPFYFNWAKFLTPREADVLGMHLFSYLAAHFTSNSVCPFQLAVQLL